MKLTTLNYIHELLLNDEKAKREAKHLIYTERNKAEDEGADNYEALCEAYGRARKSWDDSYDALRDFEEHEWR